MGNLTRELKRVINGITQWGLTGFNLKNSSGVAQIRNAADNDWADIEVQDVLIHSQNGTFRARLVVGTLAGDIDINLPLLASTIVAAGVNYSKVLAFTQATAATFTIDAAPPANGILAFVRVSVDTAAGGGSPTLQIGVAGTLGRDMATTENNLKEAGQYITEEFFALGGSPGAIIGTLVVSAQTFSGRIELHYIMP